MIGAIVVLYNPDWDLLKTGLKALIPQVDEVCIIDNSSTDNSTQFDNVGTVRYVPLLKNVGIAAAQNIGIKYFLNANFDYIIFSDQDSVMPNNLVEKLFNAYNLLKDNIDIGVIGPMPINRHNKKRYLYNDNVISNNQFYYEMHSVISSCSFIPAINFKKVGLYDENLFIDFVELDWCWKARYYNNLKIILLPDVEVQHELGHYEKFMGKDISVSSSFRLYFQIRNLFWLKNKEYTPSYWLRLNLKKLLIKILYYSIIPSNRLQYIKSIFRGFKDGFKR